MGRKIADLSDKEKAEICAFYDAGEPVDSIGETYGISSGSVSGVALAAGCKPRNVRTSQAFRMATFDPNALAIEVIEGEPLVVDTVLGAALGYERPRDVRKLIDRVRSDLLGLGGLRHRVANFSNPEGGRPTQEVLLNQAQINYLITRCGLPNADKWCIHISRVFTAWQQGRLETVDLETAVELQDGAEKATASAPELAVVTEGMLRAMLEQVAGGLATKDQANEIRFLLTALGRRKDCTLETKRQHIAAVARHYNNYCPCCGDARVVMHDGTVSGHFDHWTDCPSKNGAHETWLICAPCNSGFQTRRIDRQEHRSEFDVFQKRRKQVVEATQPSLPLPKVRHPAA